MYPTITIFFGHFPRALGQMSFFSQMCKCKTSRILFFFYFYIFFNNHKRVQVPFQNPNLKSKISHSMIDMGFIGLVTWSGVKGLWKKGLERPKECFRVILNKNLESLACTFIHSNFFGLGSTPFVLFINLYCTFVPSL